MDVLLSIKPKHLDKIISGEKKFEYRKIVWKYDGVKVYTYSSTPRKKIVGYFIISRVVEDTPSNLWRLSRLDSGLSRNEFFQYFQGKNYGYAIEILKYVQFKVAIDPYKIKNTFSPPQSFQYFDLQSFVSS